MANTFELITSTTVGSGGAASITLSSIPATFTDLLFFASLKTSNPGVAGEVVKVSYNGTSTSTNWTGLYLQGAGSGTPASGSLANYSLNVFGQSGGTALAFSNGSLYIPNYAGSNNKSTSTDSVTENNATLAYAILNANLWSNSAAITSAGFTISGGYDFAQYSSIYLYGIKNS
jgi:hypothetical protein